MGQGMKKAHTLHLHLRLGHVDKSFPHDKVLLEHWMKQPHGVGLLGNGLGVTKHKVWGLNHCT
jgi:hypothetical protein